MSTRNKDKTTDRKDTGEEESIHKAVDVEKNRTATGNRLRMDITHYLAMPEYKDKQLFWATSRNGDVEHWIACGAEPVPKKGRAGKTYAGINDRATDQYEIAHSVSVIDGIPEDNFLMFMPLEDYDRANLEPLRKHQEEIDRAMGIGLVDEGDVIMDHVKGLKTYAGKIGGGKRGLSTERVQETTHNV